MRAHGTNESSPTWQKGTGRSLARLSCILALLFGVAGARDGKADLIVWTELGSIYRANLDGSDKRLIFQSGADAGTACNLSFDPVSHKLYWDGRNSAPDILAGHAIVERMNLDGT